MTTQLSKTQIDRLGERLRRGPLTEADLKTLDDYRRSFGSAYESVVRTIREHTQLEPTGRPAKSTGALIEKLHRESIRLTQVQDIAGCRVIVRNVRALERVIVSLRKVFPEGAVVDRRVHPSYGYRAVHMILRVHGSLVEIQIRSSLQHLWAELSEKLSDVVDPAIKYGGGPSNIQDLLVKVSDLIRQVEALEAKSTEVGAGLAKEKRRMANIAKRIAGLPAKKRRKLEHDPEYIKGSKGLAKITRQKELQVVMVRKALIDVNKLLAEMLNQLIAVAHRFKGLGE